MSPPVITHVDVNHPGQKTLVRVAGTGPLDCRIMRLSDPERLVLDFQGARLARRYSSIPSSFSPVLAVRTGQFRPDVARVVIDLERDVKYRLGSGEDGVTVEFDVAASTPLPAPPSGPTFLPARAHPVEPSVPAPRSPTSAGSANVPVPSPLPGASSTPPSNSSIQPPLPLAAGPPEKQAAPFEGSFENGMLTFRTQNQSLRSVLKQIGDATGVSIHLAEALGNEQISVEFQHYRLDEALRHILSRYDAFFLYGERQDILGSPPLRAVWIYPPGRAETARLLPEVTATAGKQATPTQTASAPGAQPAPARTTSTPGLQAAAPPPAKGSDSAADVLQALKDPSAEARERALSQALSAKVQIPQETLIDLALTDPSVKVRLLALQALPVDPDLRWVAERAAGDSDPEITQAAREILRTLDLRERAKAWAAHQPKPPEQ